MPSAPVPAFSGSDKTGIPLPYLSKADHGGGGLVVFFRADAFRFRSGEHFAAQIAAQTIQLIQGGRQRRLRPTTRTSIRGSFCG